MSFLSYRRSILKEYSSRSRCVNANPNEKMEINEGTGNSNGKSYRSLIRKLLYLTNTHLDIYFTVSKLSRIVSSSTKQHLGAAKGLVRYLVGTVGFGLWYTKTIVCKLQGFTNNDWGGSLEDRKSISGMVFDLVSRAISWGSRK